MSHLMASVTGSGPLKANIQQHKWLHLWRLSLIKILTAAVRVWDFTQTRSVFLSESVCGTKSTNEMTARDKQKEKDLVWILFSPNWKD